MGLGPVTILVLLGMASWLATLILVEGELFAGLRRWVDIRYRKSAMKLIGAKTPKEAQRKAEQLLVDAMAGQMPPKYSRWRQFHSNTWYKLKYLVECHLCAGMWISLVIAAFIPPIVSPWFVGWVLNGLIIKAIGHLVLIGQKFIERWTRPGASDIHGVLGELMAKQDRAGNGSKLAPFDPMQYNSPRGGGGYGGP